MKIEKVRFEYKAGWSERQPETMEWHTVEEFCLPTEHDTSRELIQEEYGGFGKIRNFEVLSEHNLIQYILTHNNATIERAISQLRDFRKQ